MASPKVPTEIKEKKIILTEGSDAYYFSMWAYQAYSKAGIQVINFGGVKDLKKYLPTFKNFSGYENIETIVIARDAEVNSTGAVESIKTALRHVGLPEPVKHCEFVGSNPKVAYILFPGFLDVTSECEVLSSGTLEDLCLKIVENDPIFECVDKYIACLQTKGVVLTHQHKTKLHAFLAGKSDFVGLKIGEAAKAGAWDWNHSKLEPFKKLIMEM